MTESPVYDNDGILIGYTGSYLPIFDIRGCTVGHMIGTRYPGGTMFPAVIGSE